MILQQSLFDIQSATLPKEITLPQWVTISERQRQSVITCPPTSKTKFNRQDTANIEWALWSWNPVTGCLHDCPYCYARDIANRFYRELPEGERFQPVFRPYRLLAPANTKQPDLSKISDPIQRMGTKNVFTCSMADLFGKWVPREWIEAVLEQVRHNPQWNFLFLTKFPIRMAEFEYPSNAWLGTTVDYQWRVERAERAFIKLRNNGYSGIAWLSCEPMMEPLTFSRLDVFNWLAIGGASKSTQTDEFKPPVEWIKALWAQADTAGCMVYEKTNLYDGHANRRREYPWQVG